MGTLPAMKQLTEIKGQKNPKSKLTVSKKKQYIESAIWDFLRNF